MKSSAFVNLVPQARREARRRRRRLRAWIGVCAVFAVAWIAAFAAAQTAVSDDRAVRAELEEATRRAAEAQAEVTELRGELARAAAALQATRAVGRQPDWGVLMALLSTTLGEDVVLRSVKLAPLHDGRPGKHLVLRGLGRTQQAVTAFVLALEDVSILRGVRLIDTRREPFLDAHAVAFRVECRIEGDERDIEEAAP